eukprot:Hpha_TRINITY_DN11228_c0_g1::TRINITY_DN11228_c0_g1_i1::g.167526::m.167526/K05349/bglX; beta-glucosidase
MLLAVVGGLAAANAEARAACDKLSFSMKASMMGGYGSKDGYSRNSGCASECGRETFRWDNGPQGFGDNTPKGTSTQWPSSLNMGATFDPELAGRWGAAMGLEFWGKGTNIQEGPGINVCRVMRNGRTFEYISGEDPVLGSALVVPVVQGIQKNVMSIAKHYINNNQETHRSGVNEVVDEVTEMELYGPPFDAAVQHAAGVMCAYNRINGDYACENHFTLRTMLKGRYNFSGFVVSDWGGTHSTSKAITNGLDIEMPKAKYLSEDNIKAALEAGNITMANINDSCVRILSGWYNLPEERRYPCGGKICILANVSSPANKALAREISSKSTVLLKNNGGILPLDLAAFKTKKIALIGPDATAGCYTAGSGSGGVTTNATICPDVAFRALGLDITYEKGSTVDAAVAAAKAADLAIVFGSAHSGEGSDRKDLSLGGNIDSVIPAVAAAQSSTIVVMTVPGPILTPWRDAVPAILTNFLPGEQVGPAIADVLFGKAAPSAKLPVTFPNKENEQGMTIEQYPGVKTAEFDLQSNYSEGQIVGYRWYDKHAVKAAFPFGHGLTYGSFSYSGMSVEGRTLTFDVKRASGAAGTCDTPQVYLAYPAAGTDPKVPAKVLRYFEKVCADEQRVTYTFTDRDLSNWNIEGQQWKLTTGKFTVSVGSSSQDIRLQGSLTV